MTSLTHTDANRDAPSPGPFHPVIEQAEPRGELGRAVLTSLLALYPVLATVGVVLISLAYSAAA